MASQVLLGFVKVTLGLIGLRVHRLRLDSQDLTLPAARVPVGVSLNAGEVVVLMIAEPGDLAVRDCTPLAKQLSVYVVTPERLKQESHPASDPATTSCEDLLAERIDLTHGVGREGSYRVNYST